MRKFKNEESKEFKYIRNELNKIIKNLDKGSVAYPISSGLHVILNKDDADKFKKIGMKWSVQATHSGIYAFKTINKKRVYLQQFISGLRDVTFKNKFTLDCRKENLIGKNRCDVNRNRKGKSNTSTKYKGVHIKSDGRICSEFKDNLNKKDRLWLGGNWKTTKEAAKMYDAAVNYLCGDITYMNFPTNKIDEKFRELVPQFLKAREERVKRKKAKSLNEKKSS
tara:strand:- start:44 stop:712 length:669 start_codon:yes stop_codon:yes gene_type:complete